MNPVFLGEKYCIFSGCLFSGLLEEGYQLQHAVEKPETYLAHDCYEEMDEKYLLANQGENRHHRRYPGGWAYHEIFHGSSEASIAAMMGMTAYKRWIAEAIKQGAQRLGSLRRKHGGPGSCNFLASSADQ